MNLNKKSILYCSSENDIEEHNKEIEIILMELEELAKNGVIVHIKNNEKNEYIYYDSFKIPELTEIGDKKNGIDFKFENNNLKQINYGENYTFGNTNITYFLLNEIGAEKLDRSYDIDIDPTIDEDYLSLYFNKHDFIPNENIKEILFNELKPKKSLLEKAPTLNKNKDYER